MSQAGFDVAATEDRLEPVRDGADEQLDRRSRLCAVYLLACKLSKNSLLLNIREIAYIIELSLFYGLILGFQSDDPKGLTGRSAGSLRYLSDRCNAAAHELARVLWYFRRENLPADVVYSALIAAAGIVPWRIMKIGASIAPGALAAVSRDNPDAVECIATGIPPAQFYGAFPNFEVPE
ncbi:MAG: hypothetical protein AAF501_07710 [Pseudomonadota bacterium]